MDVPFYLKQVTRCLHLAHVVADPETKADLLALAYDNLELARRDALMGPKMGQARKPF